MASVVEDDIKNESGYSSETEDHQPPQIDQQLFFNRFTLSSRRPTHSRYSRQSSAVSSRSGLQFQCLCSRRPRFNSALLSHRYCRRLESTLPPPSFRRVVVGNNGCRHKRRSITMAANGSLHQDGFDAGNEQRTSTGKTSSAQFGSGLAFGGEGAKRTDSKEMSFADLRDALPSVQPDEMVPKTRCPSNGDMSCSQQAAAAIGDDTSVDELAAYFDNMVHIPRKMSFMAELMYT